MFKSLTALLAIGTTCGGLLVASNELTKSRIEANRTAQTRQLMEQLLGQPLPRDTDLTTLQHCQFSEHQVHGYAGNIHVMALWQAGEISLRVIRHQETPGIGTFIDHHRDPWLPEHDQSTQAQWRAIDSVAGATITTNAIKRAAQLTFLGMLEQGCD